jgi:hypothetical protein
MTFEFSSFSSPHPMRDYHYGRAFSVRLDVFVCRLAN